jgi:hypothetical protein
LKIADAAMRCGEDDIGKPAAGPATRHLIASRLPHG